MTQSKLPKFDAAKCLAMSLRERPLSQAAAAMGKETSPAKAAAARANGRKSTGRPALTSAVKHARKLCRENIASATFYAANGCPAMAEVCWKDADRWRTRAAQLQREGEAAL